MAIDLVLATTARQGVFSPHHDLAAESAVCVLGPERHAQMTTKANLERGRRDVRFEEPSASSRDPVEAEMRQSMALP